jgi:hypothetical protein
VYIRVCVCFWWGLGPLGFRASAFWQSHPPVAAPPPLGENTERPNTHTHNSKKTYKTLENLQNIESSVVQIFSKYREINAFKHEDSKAPVIAIVIGAPGVGKTTKSRQILTKMKYFEAFLFISMLYVMWDVCYVISFNNVIDKLPIIAYDIFVVGGFGLVSTLYIINQYKNLNLVILSILHILSILFFFYIQHRDEST